MASVLSVAAQMKEAMVELEEGSARSQVCLSLRLCLRLSLSFQLTLSLPFAFYFGQEPGLFVFCARGGVILVFVFCARGKRRARI